MNKLEQYTTTELLKYINDINIEHEKIKKEIINNTIEIDVIEEKINNKLKSLTEIENNYIILIEEFNKR